MKNTLLNSLEGLGPKISEKLINYFENEENVISALSEARISEISSIKGIGQKLALKIIQKYHAEASIDGEIYTNEILMTDDAIKIHERIVEIIKKYAQTQFIKDKFSLLYPLPRSKIEVMRSRLDNYRQKIGEFEGLDHTIIAEIKEQLKKIRPFKSVDCKKNLLLHRIIVTDDQGSYNQLIEQDVEKYAKILLVEKFSKKNVDYLNSFDLVLFITKSSIDDEFFNQIENAIMVDNWDILDLIPESAINNFTGANYQVILTSYKIMKILRKVLNPEQGVLNHFNEIKMEDINDLIQSLVLIDKNGTLVPGNDPEYDQCRDIVENFDGIIADLEMEINETIENEIKKSKAVLDGTQIFKLLQSVEETISMNQLMEFLPLNIAGIVERILMEAREQLIEKLKLDDRTGNSMVFDLYPNDVNFPIEADGFALEKLKNQLKKREKFQKFQLLTQVAKKLNIFKPTVLKIIKILFKLDELLAIKSFIEEHELTYPNYIPEQRGLSFRAGINLFLDEKEEKIIPINYHFGNVPMVIDEGEEIQGKDIIILTGANSGGKTTLLQTIAQIIMMAQMGLPVAARSVNIGAFNEIYYFSKSQGGESSGAFEASLTYFTDVIVSKQEKLVLMDELEAITEPGAAARVIGSILGMLHETRSSSTVLVSHLASQILKIIKIPVRVDGIEANGIKNGKLIVDRNPKFNYLAKSMPFYIIKKLYDSSPDSKKKQIYHQMMQYFEENLS